MKDVTEVPVWETVAARDVEVMDIIVVLNMNNLIRKLRFYILVGYCVLYVGKYQCTDSPGLRGYSFRFTKLATWNMLNEML